MTKKFTSLATAASTYALLATNAFAQGAGTINIGTTQAGRGVDATRPVQNVLTNVVTLVFTIAALLVLAYLIWGAIQWITSGGDKDKVAGARKTIISALIGLALVALAFFIVRIVGQIVGFDITAGSLTLPSLDQ